MAIYKYSTYLLPSNLVIHRQKSRSCSRRSGSCGDREKRRKSFVVKILTSKLLAIKILQSIFADFAPVKGFRRRGGGGALGTRSFPKMNSLTNQRSRLTINIFFR
jgi:hypothetical protein